ncbi:unnamed protein product [Prorocentrum cordatum]|uniref:Uncharacterized protein n=1 Tax=Prorocentrum cordatum TaxID=2364126 RepID=A0ABN9T880_9DINO|nr:unnamed protein product [Polarella glacialis]
MVLDGSRKKKECTRPSDAKPRRTPAAGSPLVDPTQTCCARLCARLVRQRASFSLQPLRAPRGGRAPAPAAPRQHRRAGRVAHACKQSQPSAPAVEAPSPS